MTEPEITTIYTIKLPGTPPSLNTMGTRGSHWATSRTKKQWEGYCTFALIEARVPRGLSFVRASAVCHFTSNRNRDEGNYRWMLEKSLGDALQLGWIEDDNADHFLFDRVEIGEKRKAPITIVKLEVRK